MDQVGKQTLEVMSAARSYNKWLFGQIRPYLRGDILEIGSGTGNFSKMLATAGNLTGIDFSIDYITHLKRMKLKSAQFGLGDIEKGKYAFGNRRFDTIVCMNVLEHIRDDTLALKNMYNLLKPGGTLVLLVPAHQWAYGLMDKNLGHYRRYNKESVEKKLGQSDFKILRTFYINFLGLAGWWFNSRVLNREILPGGQLMIFDKVSQPFLGLEGVVKPPIGLSVVSIATK